MSKKETRRAARQGQPKPVVRNRTAIRGTGQRKPRPRADNRSARAAAYRRPLRPPSLKRAAIQGAIFAVLYLIVLRYWEHGTTTATYVMFPLMFFIIITGATYSVERYTYQKRLRKQQDSSR